MADDSIEIIEPFDFHPCNTPRGSLYYNTNVLRPDQQTQLNEFKINTVRRDEKYLAENPEIRAIIALIIRHVLKKKPRQNIEEMIGMFFYRSQVDIEDEVDEYIGKVNTYNIISDMELQMVDDEDEGLDNETEQNVIDLDTSPPLEETTKGENDLVEQIEEEEDTSEDLDSFIRNILYDNIENMVSTTSIAKSSSTNSQVMSQYSYQV